MCVYMCVCVCVCVLNGHYNSTIKDYSLWYNFRNIFYLLPLLSIRLFYTQIDF